MAMAVIASCSGDSSAFIDPSAQTDAEQLSDGDPSDDGGDTSGDDTSGDDTSGDEIPDDWIVEETGFCDNPQNQVYMRRVKDGDTITLKQLVDGSDAVRYIGVDASELFKDECYSYEAQEALIALIPPGKPLCLIADSEQETKDMYNRLLRYVYMHDGQRWVQQNARLVRIGAARAYHKWLKGMDYQWEILDAENKAFKEKRGGWADCDW
jgi:endonuclease YncB( thermonuclease family)